MLGREARTKMKMVPQKSQTLQATLRLKKWKLMKRKNNDTTLLVSGDCIYPRGQENELG